MKPDVTPGWLALGYVGEKCGHCWTLCLLGDPIGCCGIAVEGSGERAQVWGHFTPLLKTFPVWLFKFAKARLEEVANEEPLLREYFALAEVEDEAAQRFLDHLGFEQRDPETAAKISAELKRAMRFYQRRSDG